MTQIETAEMIAEKRIVSAAALLENRADLRTYPHRYLSVQSYVLVRMTGLRMLLTAVEYLEQFGWQLVNILEFDNQLTAVMRRT